MRNPMKSVLVKLGAVSLFASIAVVACAPVDDSSMIDESANDDNSALTGPVCLGTQSGAYCGNDMMQNADPNTLYYCPGKGMAPTQTMPCAGGCAVAPPGSPDYCKKVSGPICLGTQSGAYCGNDLMQNADPNTLYNCPGKGMAPTEATPCASGCVVAPAGYADYCDTAAPPPPPSGTPKCLGSAAGAYCGSDMMENADPNTLYTCPGAGMEPTQATPCAEGCAVAPPGSPDYCKSAPGSANSYRLPWHAGTSMQLTQDCNDSCCSDHVGNDKYSWDFARGGEFTVVAARGGTITHLKMNSTTGCGSSSCANYANYIVIDHGDGTQSTYLHLKGGSLKSGLYCGATVTQGQELATAGTTGWSTGIHLHYEASKVHPNVTTCECGSDGQGCSTSTVKWSLFWPNSSYPTVPIAFDEWSSASSCNNRRMAMPGSQN